MVISNPFAQLLLLVTIRGVSSPPLLSKTIFFLLYLGVVSSAMTVWTGSLPLCLGEGLILIRPSGYQCMENP